MFHAIYQIEKPKIKPKKVQIYSRVQVLTDEASIANELAKPTITSEPKSESIGGLSGSQRDRKRFAAGLFHNREDPRWLRSRNTEKASQLIYRLRKK